MTNTLQYEALYLELDNFVESVNDQMKIWIRYDTICCMESSQAKTDNVITNLISTIHKLLQEVANMISKGMKSLTNHIRYGLLSKEKKQEFDNFQEWVNNNPRIKNKKVTVKDWKRIISQYDEISKQIVKYMDDEKVDAKGLNLKAYELLNNVSSVTNSATAVLTIDSCMFLARQSTDMAKAVQTGLSECDAAIKNIENQLGTAEVQKLQKNIQKLTKQSVAQKIRAKILGEKQKSISECLNELYTEFGKISSGEGMTFFQKVNTAVKHRDGVIAGAKAYAKNEDTRKGIKQLKSANNKLSNSSIGNSVKEFFKPNV